MCTRLDDRRARWKDGADVWGCGERGAMRLDAGESARTRAGERRGGW